MEKYAHKNTATDAEKFASTEISEMTTPEYIHEIKLWLS
jgi:hypothetical protein